MNKCQELISKKKKNNINILFIILFNKNRVLLWKVILGYHFLIFILTLPINIY